MNQLPVISTDAYLIYLFDYYDQLLRVKIQCSQQVPLLRLDDQQVALLKGDCLRKALISSGVNH